MPKRFSADSVLCNQIFDGREGIYEIPNFQRPYSWGGEEVGQLFQDIYEAWKENKDSYYIGPIILVNENGEKSKRLKIIDGQQRLTTLTILYAVYKHCFKDELNEGNAESVERRVYEVTLKNSLDHEPYRLRVGEKYQAHFLGTILKDFQLEKDNRYTRMASLLKSKLESNFDNSEDLNSFLSFVDDCVELVKIQTEEFTDGIRVFLTINTRGKGLALSDKVKSYLLGMTENSEEREDIVDVWRDIVDEVGDDYGEIDTILQSYRLYLKEEKAKRKAFVELKGEFSKKEPLDMITEFRDYVICYRKVTKNYSGISEEQRRKIFMLKKLRHDQWADLLAVAEMEGVEYFAELLDELVAFYYSYWVGGYTAAKTKNRSIQILKKVKKSAEIGEIREYIEKKRNEHNVRERVKEALNSRDVTEGSWHKRLLVVLEYTMATPRVIEEIKLGKDTHREHILPGKHGEAMKKHPYWKERFEGKEPEKLKDSLGNLVLLQYDLNEALKQKPYPEKRKYYRGEKAPQGKKKKETSFRLTRKVADKFEDWNPDAIKENKELFIAGTEELLNFPENSLIP